MTLIPSNDWLHDKPKVIGTYHIPLIADAALVTGGQFVWDSALIGTITIWTCELPASRVAINDATAGFWIQQQPTTGYTAVSPAGAATIGASPLLITIPGGIAGGVSVQLGNIGSARAKAVLTVTTQGEFWSSSNGKE